MILEAAEDIVTVRFNSQHPYIIAAACLSGMIVLWDLSPHAGLLKGVKSKWSTRASAGTPVIVPVAATLENYPALTRRIEWTPSSVEVCYLYDQFYRPSLYVKLFSFDSLQPKDPLPSPITKRSINCTVATMVL